MNTLSNRISPEHIDWMARTPGLQHLRIDELVLPGTHNAGTDKQSPNLGLFQEYCQDVAPIDQLRGGIWALDLRVSFYENREPGSAERFQLFHLTSSGRTVSVDILQRLREFYEALERNGSPAREVVILDFHQFKNFTANAHKELQALLLDALGDRIVPYDLGSATLAQLWHYHPGKTVVIAYNSATDGRAFWDGVNQRWPGENLFNTNRLKAFIDDVAEEHKPDFHLQAIQCAKYSLPFHAPTDLSHKINQWFESVDQASYIQNFYIINTDWSLRSEIVAHCRHANQIRAERKLSHPHEALQPLRR